MGKIDKEAIARRFIDRFKSLDLKPHAFEHEQGLSTGTIKRIRGGGGIGSDKIVQLAAALGLKTEYLLTGKPPKLSVDR